LGNNTKQRVAGGISHLLSPAGVAMLALLLISGGRSEDMWVLLGLCLYVVVPLLVLLLLLWHQRCTGDTSDVYDPTPVRRQAMLNLGVVTYALCLVVLSVLEAPPLYCWAGATFLGGAAAVWGINRFWKISIHATGAGGAAALVTLAEASGWPLALGLPVVVGWARWEREAHTGAQLVAGTLLGALVAWVCREIVL